MKLVLFGAGELARLAYIGFANESAYDVVACALTREYISSAAVGEKSSCAASSRSSMPATSRAGQSFNDQMTG